MFRFMMKSILPFVAPFFEHFFQALEKTRTSNAVGFQGLEKLLKALDEFDTDAAVVVRPLPFGNFCALRFPGIGC